LWANDLMFTHPAVEVDSHSQIGDYDVDYLFQ
jgi:hypothetical protein